MSSQVNVAITALQSLLQTTGLFKSVRTVEPKQPPEDVTAAIFLSGIRFLGTISGLDRGSAVYEFTLRLYSNAMQNPTDQIDPKLVTIVDKVMDALCGDFTFGGNIRNIDVLGQTGTALSARAGHVDVSGTIFRAIDITIPLIVNDTVVFTP